ncbi:MAG: hypothetical protein WEE20_14325 [Bacteroidota bacterium]
MFIGHYAVALAGTLIVEIGLFAGGIALYLRTTEAKDRTGVYAFWLFVAWAYWIDKHRGVKAG